MSPTSYQTAPPRIAAKNINNFLSRLCQGWIVLYWPGALLFFGALLQLSGVWLACRPKRNLARSRRKAALFALWLGLGALCILVYAAQQRDVVLFAGQLIAAGLYARSLYREGD